MEMVGHASIVYSVDSHVSGLIVSGSEDCSAKIWKGLFLLFVCLLRCNLKDLRSGHCNRIDHVFEIKFLCEITVVFQMEPVFRA